MLGLAEQTHTKTVFTSRFWGTEGWEKIHALCKSLYHCGAKITRFRIPITTATFLMLWFAFLHYSLNLSNDRLKLDDTLCAFMMFHLRLTDTGRKEKNGKKHQAATPTGHVNLLIHRLFLKKCLLSSGWPVNVSYSSMWVLSYQPVGNNLLVSL